MALVLLVLILVFMVASFVLEKLPVDVTAFVALGLLLLFGLVTPEQAISGFGNAAVITVMMMFVLSEGLVQSGMVRRIGYLIMRLAGRAEGRASSALMTITGAVSAFINNTAAVSIFIPVALRLAKRYRTSPSKLLIPLSYAAIAGGTCTLIGTSTNILVSSLAVLHGLPPFSVFEFFYLGGVLFVLALAFNVWIAPRLLPERASQASLSTKYRLSAFLTELRVAPESRLIGKTVLEEDLHDRYRVRVLEIVRDGHRITSDLRHTELVAGDALIVQGTMEDILALKEQFGLLLLTDLKLGDDELTDDNNVLVEMQLAPTSDLVGATLREIDFRKRFSCFVLALARTGEAAVDKVAAMRLQPWDALLIFGPRQRIEGLAGSGHFLPLQELPMRLKLPRRWWIGASVIPLVVLLAAFGAMPILKSAILGVAVLLVTRTVRIQQAYRAIDWTVIFLLAALLPVGIAMETTGLGRMIGEAIVGVGAPAGPWVVLSLIILATSLLTEAITNNSAAVLMVPIVLPIAEQLGVDPKPFLMGLAFAASMSFATPTGYQTNTMVYGPGGYRFTDYLRVGVPLNLLFWLVSSIFIPIIWPF